jgi:hypothetical protein
MEEYVHRTHIPLAAKVIRGITQEWKKWYSLKFELHLPFMVSDLVYKFQMICFREN